MIGRHLTTFHAAVADNPNTPENEQQPAHTDPPAGRFDAIGSGTADLADYQLADPQGSVVAVLADAPAVGPRLVDEVEYEPYGRARRTAQGDFNHSGSITPQDNYDFLNAYFAAAPAGDVSPSIAASTYSIDSFIRTRMMAPPVRRVLGRVPVRAIISRGGRMFREAITCQELLN